MLRNQKRYKVISNKKVCANFFRLSLNAKFLLKKIKPGQFVHLRVSDGLKPFFRRPFSVFRAQKSLEILYEVVGDGTQILSKKKRNSSIDCLGPLGTPFSMPPKGIKQVVMVAGGVGVAPFLLLTDKLKNKGYDLILLYGGRTRGHVFSFKEFQQNGCKVFVSTDDGSIGVKGRVSKLFTKINLAKPTFIYTCGPKPMMASVQAFAKKNKIKGQASLEEVMACGVGTCLGCSTKTKHGYKTVCHDGPVFDLDEVIFQGGA
ncbi:MAG: dihydroorotate dehydrogenase electron transfer subunit [Candidatus Aceula meridiana]|nr:dihydroorotate dehydrogenase electron transfer subunit [Candidatus Aceula meridiana]